jgi:hypothetical protein
MSLRWSNPEVKKCKFLELDVLPVEGYEDCR